MPRLIAVSNRTPAEGPVAGGLAVALKTALADRDGFWFGWSGNLVAEPKLVKLAVNGTTATTPTYKWFVMATSGFNNYRVDGNQSSNGKPGG